MATQTITYTNKADLYTDSSIADINKVKADDMNEIKGVVNNNAGELETLQTTVSGIISSGSNTNGNWIKYADGTMICYRSFSKTFNVNEQWGSIYVGYDLETTYNFAQTFINVPIVIVDIIPTTATGLIKLDYYERVITTSGVKSLSICRPTSSSVPTTVQILAIGKWK